MTVISDLSQDLIEEILSRVPLTSLRAVRSTCKPWNVLSKHESFTKKHLGKLAKEILVPMVCEFSIYLMKVNLQGVYSHKDGLLDLSVKQIGKLNQVEISKVFHCDGLLLCVPKYTFVQHVLMVWNPYLGKVRKIQARYMYKIFDKYNIGYDMNKNHKILRSLEFGRQNFEYEIYDFKSNSWRVLNVAPDWYIPDYRHGLSLKGNTYFVAQERLQVGEGEMEEFLLCFNFTTEQFGPRVPLLYNSCNGDWVILSAVREEQLAVLFHRISTNEMEIRIITEIEPNAVLWSSFLKVDMRPFPRRRFPFKYWSFFVDEKKKIAVIFGNETEGSNYNKAFVIGKDGYNKSYCLPFVCSYVPSSVQIQQHHSSHVWRGDY